MKEKIDLSLTSELVYIKREYVFINNQIDILEDLLVDLNRDSRQYRAVARVLQSFAEKGTDIWEINIKIKTLKEELKEIKDKLNKEIEINSNQKSYY